MDIMETVRSRHSVRAFTDRKIDSDTASILQSFISKCNEESGLDFKLVLEEPNALDCFKSHLRKFSNAKNYVVLIGKKSDDLDEKVGYYGEKVVLKATEMGLGTCWVVSTYSKKKCEYALEDNEKLVGIIAFGYSDTHGVPHDMKSVEELSRVNGDMPDWFRRGMEAVRYAPTSFNQQKFLFSLDGNTVSAKTGIGIGTKIDLGIAKCHFDLCAGDGDWKWSN